jgi:hypothetical protein
MTYESKHFKGAQKIVRETNKASDGTSTCINESGYVLSTG